MKLNASLTPIQSIPASWTHFINLIDNKTNLIRFLTTELLKKADDLPGEQELVLAGGSETPDIVLSTSSGVLHHLRKQTHA